MYVVRHMSHTSQRAATTGEGHEPAKGLALQAQRALEERDEVFIVLFGLFSGCYEKGETGWCAQRVVATHKVVVARSDMSICHLFGWLLVVVRHSHIICHQLLFTNQMRAVLPNQTNCCVAVLKDNADKQRPTTADR